MEKQFTLELITKIADAIRISGDDIIEGSVVTVVDDVELRMEGRKSDFQTGFGPDSRHVVDITYGKMGLAHGISLGVLRMHYNPFINTLIEALGPQTVRLEMRDLIAMVQQNATINALTSNSSRYSNSQTPTDFSIKLPGDVIFGRTPKTLYITRAGEEVFSLKSIHANVIDQNSSMAAELALLTADPIELPARIVDTSVETQLFNGVLYKKVVEGKKVEFYFDDNRTRDFIFKQSGSHTLTGVWSQPTLLNHHHNHSGPHGYS